MSLDDPRSYQRYEENVDAVGLRLEFAGNIERLQDDMRRIKEEISYQAFADLIPRLVAEYAPAYPTGGDISSQESL